MDSKENKDVYSVLHELGIPFTEITHVPVFSVADAQAIKSRIMGVGCKNLLLTDHKQKDYILLLLEESKRADLQAVAKLMGTSRLTFATPSELWDYLRLMPGSVSPFGLLYDKENRVKVVIDAALKNQRLLLHPNINTKTLGIWYDDLIRFLVSTGHHYELL